MVCVFFRWQVECWKSLYSQLRKEHLIYMFESAFLMSLSCVKIPSVMCCWNWLAVCSDDINIPTCVNTQKWSDCVWAWPSKMGKEESSVRMILTATWGSIQHTQRIKRYHLYLEVMLQSRTVLFSNCSQPCFCYCMSVGIVGHCTPLDMGNQCSVRWAAELSCPLVRSGLGLQKVGLVLRGNQFTLPVPRLWDTWRGNSASGQYLPFVVIVGSII